MSMSGSQDGDDDYEGKMKVQLGFAMPLEHEQNDDDDDDDEYNAEYNAEQEFLHIGHKSPNWLLWDGGKIGGVPSWLNPRDLPNSPIYCLDCTSPKNKQTKMRFVAQLYCPLDKNINEDAFHRSLYVFVCPNSCHSDGSMCGKTGSGSGGGVRILRCQLPQSNPFYPDELDEEENEEDENENDRIMTVTHLPTDGWDIHICKVCGQRGKGKCPIQKEWFCGKECQKEYMKFMYPQILTLNKKEENEDAYAYALEKIDVAVPSLYKEMELVVEEEPPKTSSSFKNTTADTNADSTDIDIPKSNDQKHKLNQELLKKIKKDAWFDSKKDGDPEQEQDDDDDENLEQSDLNEMTGLGLTGGGTTDKTTLKFFHRIDRLDLEQKSVKDQCLRYQRCWTDDGYDDDYDYDDDDEKEKNDDNDVKGPLWISSQNIPTSYDNIPKCPYCNGERKFEFQIMPQMLHYLQSKVSSNGSGSKDDDDKTTSTPTLTEEAKQAILAISNIREKEGDENIQQEYIQKHEEALAMIKNELLGNHSKQKDTMDWGVIAVFTCTNSCSKDVTVELGQEEDGGGDDDTYGKVLGAYAEEFGWRQPPLGA